MKKAYLVSVIEDREGSTTAIMLPRIILAGSKKDIINHLPTELDHLDFSSPLIRLVATKMEDI